MRISNRNLSGRIFQSMLLAVLVILLGTIAIGCSSGPPDKVVAKFTMAIADRDLDKAKTFCTERFANVYLTSMEAINQAMPPGTMPGRNLEIEDVRSGMQVSEDGDTAKVWMTDVEFIKYVLIKEGGSWKIDSLDMDMEAMMDQLEEIGFEMPDIPQ